MIALPMDRRLGELRLAAPVGDVLARSEEPIGASASFAYDLFGLCCCPVAIVNSRPARRVAAKLSLIAGQSMWFTSLALLSGRPKPRSSQLAPLTPAVLSSRDSVHRACRPPPAAESHGRPRYQDPGRF
jgi:hypothetical protein